MINRGYKKILIISICILCFGFNIIGCTRSINISIDEIQNKIIKYVDTNNMKKGDNKSLRRYFGISIDDVEDYILYLPKTNMDVEELLILKVDDISKIDAIDEAIESRINKQLQNFNGYGVNQTALLENYEIKIKDKYVFYTVSKDAQNIKDNYMKIIKNKGR